MVLALVPDLMLASRVRESLSAAGHQVVVRAGLDGEEGVVAEDFDVIVADLEAIDPDSVKRVGLPCLGFYSHVDLATRENGLRAGIDTVVPRSRMARELPKLVERLIGV